jgi:hypothetical protein
MMLVQRGANSSSVDAYQGSSDPGVVRRNRGSGDPLRAQLTGERFLPRGTRGLFSTTKYHLCGRYRNPKIKNVRYMLLNDGKILNG